MSRLTPDISSRKKPRQARSNDLIAAVLVAAVQVLKSEGASRFTTARVARRAGVSVGSLYQYFPNKAAILFRLQAEEWTQTTKLLRGLLEDTCQPPLQRLRAVVHAFLRSECEEAQMRQALADAAPLYRDAPEAAEASASGSLLFRSFMAEVLPATTDATRLLAADLIEATLTRVGSHFSEDARTDAEVATYADAMADMFCAYLAQVGGRSAEGR